VLEDFITPKPYRGLPDPTPTKIDSKGVSSGAPLI
jgi:hypothetical protein